MRDFLSGPRTHVLGLLAAGLLIACSSSPDPVLGGLDGRYEGTLTIEYRGTSKTLGMSMVFESNGAVTSHSELDEPQHNYYRLRDDRTAIDLYNKHKVLFGHLQLTELTPDRIKGYMIPDNGTRDLGTSDLIDMQRVVAKK